MYVSTITRQLPSSRLPGQFAIAPLESICLNGQGRSGSLAAPAMFSMIVVQQPGGTIQIGKRSLLLESNTLYWISPHQQIALELETSTRGFMISFSNDFIDLSEKQGASLSRTAFFKRSLLYPAIQLPAELNQQLAGFAGNMLKEYASAVPQSEKLIRNYLNVFLVYLERLCEVTMDHSLPSREQDISLHFFSLLEQHFLQKKRVSDYADMMGLTPSYLNKRIKDNSGFTASHHIQQRIVLEAKRHAIFEGDSLKEVAYALGFCTPAHFSRYFKNSAGMNFTAFRKTA
ncbi:helix-turn-helix domain-containing protein [Paraflavitalea pollutisoli]|uniref:helix-turn-helix domain-containing protein n=1 Tax=Paraflavitalea pollutisoli TaxID=3034143 RepID=UPI0023ED0522|nr:helix-turn-helix domain-containing protein [Paraflavitalea sp. H1-2-19X]